MQAVTVRFPDQVYELLRKTSYDQRISMNTLVVVATREQLTQDGSEVPYEIIREWENEK